MVAAGSRPVVVVGAGPAGLATARAYRDAGGRGAVTLVGSEPHLPYERPPLTKEALRGDRSFEGSGLVDAAWFVAHDVLVRFETVVGIDRVAGSIVLQSDDELPYDALVLATGASPARLAVPGADDPDVLVLRTCEDAELLCARVGSGRGVHVAVIGSGFIGCEAAASLRWRGADVTLVGSERVPQAARVGDEAGSRIAGWLRDEGVRLALGAPVVEIVPDGPQWVVVSASGEVARAEVVLLASGIRRGADLAAACGLELTAAGAIATDACMRTSDPAIFAVGDVAGPLHPLAGRQLALEHWDDALALGVVAGRRLAGDRDAVWDAAPGFWSTIGPHTIHYAGWGDGYDEARFVDGDDGAFTVWYGRDGVTVGVLAHAADDDLARGRAMVERGAKLP